jgi:hypothetical protein
MTFEIPGKTFTAPAAADLSSYRYKGVYLDYGGKAAVPAAGAAIDGVLQNRPSVMGRSAVLMKNGLTKMIAAETITPGQDLSVDAQGAALVADSGERIVGRSVTGGDATELITVALGNDGSVA